MTCLARQPSSFDVFELIKVLLPSALPSKARIHNQCDQTRRRPPHYRYSGDRRCYPCRNPRPTHFLFQISTELPPTGWGVSFFTYTRIKKEPV